MPRALGGGFEPEGGVDSVTERGIVGAAHDGLAGVHAGADSEGRGQGQSGADFGGGVEISLMARRTRKSSAAISAALFVDPHGHDSVADVFLCPTAFTLGDLAGAEEPGADGLGELGFGEAAGERA